MKKIKYSNNVTIFTADDYAVIEFNTMLSALEKSELRKHIQNSHPAITLVFFRQYKIDRWKTKRA
jgi:hypothetical protein